MRDAEDQHPVQQFTVPNAMPVCLGPPAGPGAGQVSLSVRCRAAGFAIRVSRLAAPVQRERYGPG